MFRNFRTCFSVMSLGWLLGVSCFCQSSTASERFSALWSKSPTGGESIFVYSRTPLVYIEIRNKDDWHWTRVPLRGYRADLTHGYPLYPYRIPMKASSTEETHIVVRTVNTESSQITHRLEFSEPLEAQIVTAKVTYLDYVSLSPSDYEEYALYKSKGLTKPAYEIGPYGPIVRSLENPRLGRKWNKVWNGAGQYPHLPRGWVSIDVNRIQGSSSSGSSSSSSGGNYLPRQRSYEYPQAGWERALRAWNESRPRN